MQNTDPLYITRFVAAMAIVVHHFLPGSFRVGGWENLFHNFNEGVNYFYFLSGFVMIIAYQKYLFGREGGIPKMKYWIKRFARIYPVYLLALLILLSFHFLVQPSFTSVWQRLPFELAMVQQWVGFGSLNSPAWSVSCEVFFYLAFPFFIMKLATLEGKRWVNYSLAWMGVILMLTFVAYFVVGKITQGQSSFSGILYGIMYYHPVLRITSFIAGCLGGIWFLKNRAFQDKMRPYSIYILAVSMTGVLLVMFALPVKDAIWLNYGLLCPLYFLFVVSICNVSGWLLRALSSKLCIFLGDISYGLYILQVPIQMYFAHYFQGTQTIAGFLAYSAILILVSALSYILLEKPMRKGISEMLTRRFDGKPSLNVSTINQ